MDLKPERLPALDATRGLAILLMVLSGVIPYGTLPAWMYHAQIPPPDHTFNPALPGFTWVDLVFPLFIFCLGMAIPIALKSKDDSGFLRKAFYLLKRSFFLVAFAIIIQHLRPHQIETHPTTQTWLLSLAGFLLMFLCFSTYPNSLANNLKLSIRLFSWVCLLLLIGQITYKNGEGYSWYRSDIIILVLANVYFFGTLIHLTTKNKLFFKVLIALFLLSLRIIDVNFDWLTKIEGLNPVSWLFQLKFLQYLFIAIPGIIIGEVFVQRQYIAYDLSKNTKVFLSLTCLVLIISTIIFLQVRYVVPFAVVITLINMSAIYLLFKNNKGTLPFKLFLMAGILITIGFLTESFEGGIKKDPSTFSYYFISSGLSCYILLIFHFLKPKYFDMPLFKLLVNNGKNPMMAYVAFANFLWPILALTGLELWFVKITAEPWLGFLRGLAYTFIIAILVSFFTHNKYFWKT